jgi:hypothetical protein
MKLKKIMSLCLIFTAVQIHAAQPNAITPAGQLVLDLEQFRKQCVEKNSQSSKEIEKGNFMPSSWLHGDAHISRIPSRSNVASSIIAVSIPNQARATFDDKFSYIIEAGANPELFKDTPLAALLTHLKTIDWRNNYSEFIPLDTLNNDGTHVANGYCVFRRSFIPRIGHQFHSRFVPKLPDSQ